MEAVELARDLWRWTGRDPATGADVGSVYYKTGRDILLFDPLLPPEDPDGFWRALDRDVVTGDTVHVLLTSQRHARSTDAMLARYEKSRLWGLDPDPELLAGVTAYPSGREDEVVFHIPEHRALVVGDGVAGALDLLERLEIELVIPSHGEPARGADALRGLAR